MNRFYISFDDTDNLQSPGTGHLLNGFLDDMKIEFDFISRHQLFVSPDVPYTSHNSAMCAIVSTVLTYDELIEKASRFLEDNLAPGADPGLCVADPELIKTPEMLVQWGYRAKKEVLTKADAYALAECGGVHLSEHGGTGQGVVGALASVGLRIGGNDGRVKGKKTVSGTRLTVGELLKQTGFQRVCAYGIGQLSNDTVVNISDNRIKAVYQNFQSTVLVTPRGNEFEVVTKDKLKCY